MLLQPLPRATLCPADGETYCIKRFAWQQSFIKKKKKTTSSGCRAARPKPLTDGKWAKTSDGAAWTRFTNQTTLCFIVQPIIYLNIRQTTNEGRAGCDTKKYFSQFIFWNSSSSWAAHAFLELLLLCCHPKTKATHFPSQYAHIYFICMLWINKSIRLSTSKSFISLLRSLPIIDCPL